LTCGGIFDVDRRQERLIEVRRELEDPKVWNDSARAQELGRERAQLERVVDTYVVLEQGLRDAAELIELVAEEDDPDTVNAVGADLEKLEGELKTLEFQRMFSGEADANNAFLDIQAGSGGTEAQDWAEMLLRMYLRWAEKEGFKAGSSTSWPTRPRASRARP